VPTEPAPEGSTGGQSARPAVFLSYASEDAAAAERISAALQSAGVEVWFDRGELRGGDAWDHTIRKEIRDCALFIPLVSANSQARTEGYFRLEWRLADQRTHLMGRNRAFLLPVCIDDTRDADADVPDSFLTAQWTRLPQGAATPAFVQRVVNLLARVGTPPPASATESRNPAAPHAPRLSPAVSAGRNRARVVAGVVVGLLAVLIAGYLVRERTRTTGDGALAGATGATSTVEGASIAVLPFADMSERKDQEYFSDGLAEELLDQLAKTPGLRVTARTSSFAFKGKSEDVPTIARQLNVANILEGSVRKAGARLRVTTQLIRASDGTQLWSETYDREMKDVFAVQDEIADAVVTALKGRLLATGKALMHTRTANPDAYIEYLLGRSYYRQASEASDRLAVKAFRRAVALDPDYGPAYASLALAAFYTAYYDADSKGEEQAFALADKAIELAPEFADGYGSRAYLRFWFRLDWDGARTDFEKAVSLSPNDGDHLRRYSQYLATRGRMTDAIAYVRRATEADPMSALTWNRLSRYLLATRQYGQARTALARARALMATWTDERDEPTVLEVLDGHLDAARALAEASAFPESRLWRLAIIEHTAGHEAASRAARDEFERKYGGAQPFDVARIHAWCGDVEATFTWLETALKAHAEDVVEVTYDPLFAPVRADPRYRAFLRKLGLSD